MHRDEMFRLGGSPVHARAREPVNNELVIRLFSCWFSCFFCLLNVLVGYFDAVFLGKFYF